MAERLVGGRRACRVSWAVCDDMSCDRQGQAWSLCSVPPYEGWGLGAVPTLPVGTEAVCCQPGLPGADTRDHTLCPQQLCYPMFETMAPFPEGFLNRVLQAVTHCVSREVAWSWGWGPRPCS